MFTSIPDISMTKDHFHLRHQMRELIAQTAARLIAEDGIQDYALAKRKAARQVGAPDSHSLPANSEVLQALRAYQELYQKDEQPLRLRQLRQEALAFMLLLERFNPHLTGSVLTGTATRHSDINLQLFTDSAKEVELFLINRNMPYETSEKRYWLGDEFFQAPTFTLFGDATEIKIAIFATDDLRKVAKNPTGSKPLERARIKQVEALLETGS